jgi:hypothetical protein
VDVRQRSYGALHAVGSLLAEHERVDATDTQERRALEGHYPEKPEEIIEWLEEAARGWNRDPTPFERGGRRAVRRERVLSEDAMLWEDQEPVRGGPYEGEAKAKARVGEMAASKPNDPLV